MPFSVLLLIKNQQYFIFKKINSSCQLLARYTYIKSFYRSLLILQKGLQRLRERCFVVQMLFAALKPHYAAQILFAARKLRYST